jgi:hypothetical protein
MIHQKTRTRPWANDGPLAPVLPAVASHLCLGSSAHGGSYLAVPIPRRMLIDQRCSHASVAHPVHQLTSAGAGGRGEVVARVTQVVKVKLSRQASELDGLSPATDRSPEVGSAQLRALGSGEITVSGSPLAA